MLEHQRLDDADGDQPFEPLQLAENEGAMRPGACERDEEVIAAGFGRIARACFADTMPKPGRRALEGAAAPAGIVPFVAPDAFDELAHARAPAATFSGRDAP